MFCLIKNKIILGEALICYQCNYCEDISLVKNITQKNCTGTSNKPLCVKIDNVLSKY